MPKTRSSFGRRLFAVIRNLVLALLFLGSGRLHAQTREALQFSLEAYDGLFSTLAPGQETVAIGDMLFKVEELREFREKIKAKLDGRLVAQGAFDFASNKQWPNGVVPYVYDKSVPQATRTLFESAIREWQEHANLNFVPRAGHANYVTIKFTGYTNGAPMNSFVGMVGGSQVLNVAGWGNKIDCAHELGHALGMTHEQCRSDRDTYVRIIATNLSVNPANNVNYAIVPRSINRTDYDFDSLMHYPRDAFPSKYAEDNGLPNLLAKAPYEKWSDGKGPEEIGQKTHLSAGDKMAMSAQYGTPIKIGGRIVDGAGRPLAGVQVSIGGGSPYRGANPIFTDADGKYSFTGIPQKSGTYTITPSQPGTSFTEASRIAVAETLSHESVGFTSVDSAPPGLTIASPTISGVYSAAPLASGTASDGIAVKEVRVALARTADGMWWNWNEGGWLVTFDWAKTMRVASGTANWSTALPALPVGGYQVHVQSVDSSDNASDWAFRHFFVDPEPPVVAVTQPIPGSTVSELHQIRGTATDGAGTGIKDGRVYFTLYQNGDFWTGFHWKSNTSAQDPEVLLYADVVDGQWIYNSVPGGGHSHGSSSGDRHGTFYVSLFARDNAGNLSVPTPGVNSVEFTVDHSPPSISITTPADGSTVTNLLSISGTAKDSKSLESVRLYLYRFSDGKFWDGTAWGGGGSAILPVQVDTNAGTWVSTGTLPSNLTRNSAHRLSNGGYNIIAFAVDSAGNQTRSDAVITVENHMPVLFTLGSYSDSNRDNNNENWDNPANWNIGYVPDAEDIAVINEHSPIFTGTKTVHGLRLGGGEIRGGKIIIPRDGEFTWAGGTLRTDVTIEEGGAFRITGTANKTLESGHRIENHGAGEWDGTSHVSARGQSVFENRGSIAADGNVTFTYYNNGVYPVGAFVNAGTIVKQGAGVLRFSGDYGGWFLTNSGALNISEGQITLQNDTTHLGGSISGAGQLVMEGGNLHVNSTTTLEGGTVELRSGTLRGGGTFTGPGTFLWSGGTLDGDITVAAGSNLRLAGDQRIIASGARVQNFGAAVWQTGMFRVSGKSRFENSGRLDINGTVQAYYYNNGVYPRGEFENTGLVTINHGSTVQFPNDYGGWHFNNKGETRVVNGWLVLGGGGIHTNAVFDVQAGTLEFAASGEKHVFEPGDFSVRGQGKILVTGAELEGREAGFLLAEGVTWEHASGRTEGAFDFDGSGKFVWRGGTLNSTTLWGKDVKVEISGADPKHLQSGRITSLAKVVWTGAGNLHAQGQAVFRNEGDFEIQNDASFYYYNNGVYPQGIFENIGALRKTGATNSTTFRGDYGGWTFVNRGVLDIRSGSLDLDIERATFGDRGTISGEGSLRIRGGNTTWEGTNLVQNGTVRVIEGNLNSAEGRLEGPGSLVWSGGRFNGAINIGLTNFSIAGAADKHLTSSSIIRNDGLATWEGAGSLRLTGASLIENRGQFEARQDGSIYYYNNGVYPKGTFRNIGLFVKTGGTNSTTLHDDYGGPLFHNTGTIDVRSGRLSLGGGGDWINGTVKVAPASEISLFSGPFRFATNNAFFGATVIRGAEVTMEGTNHLAAASRLAFASGAIFGSGTMNGPGVFEWSGGRVNGEVRIGTGTTWELTGEGEKLFQAGRIENHGQATWRDHGTFRANGGALVSNLGTFTMLGNGAFTYYNNGVYPRGHFHNAGLLRKSGSDGASTFADDYGGWAFSNDGTIQVDSGVLRLTAESWFTNSVVKGAGRIRAEGGAVHFAGGTTLDGGTFELSGGFADGSTTISGPGVFEWSGGELRGSHKVAANGRMSLVGNNDKPIASGSSLTNEGSLAWAGGHIRGSGQSQIINKGLLEINCDAGVIYYNNGVYPIALFENSGTIRKAGTTGKTTMRDDYGGWKFANPGTLEVQTGVFHVGNNYEAGAATKYILGVAGTAAGSDFGQVEFPQAAALQGAVKVALANGYVPAGTNSYALFTYPSRSGEFAATEFPAASPGQQWALSYGDRQAELKLAAVVQAHNSSFGRTATGGFQLTLSGPPGSEAWLQASSNLVDWVSVQTNKPFSGEFQFAEPTATNRARFYRTLILP